MYLCICNTITQKMVSEDSTLYAIIGNKCGKCMDWIKDNKYPGTDIEIESVTYLVSEAKIAANCYDSDTSGNFI